MNERNELLGVDASAVFRDLARRAAVSEAELEERIRTNRDRSATSEDHLIFVEASDVSGISTDRAAHLDTCKRCQELIQALRPSQAVVETLTRRLLDNPHQPAGTWSWSTMRWLAAAAVLAVLVVSPLVVSRLKAAYLSDKARLSLLARLIDLEKQQTSNDNYGLEFESAKLKIRLHQETQAADDILNGLMKGGISAHEVDRIRQAIAGQAETDPARQADALRSATAIRGSSLMTKPEAYLEKAHLQWKGGDALGAYVSIRSYLLAREGGQPATEAYGKVLSGLSPLAIRWD